MARELLQDLGELEAFLRSQRTLVSEEVWSQTVRQNTKNLLQRVSGLPKLSAGEATKITAALSTLPFTDEPKQALSAAVNESLLRAQQTPKGGVTMQNVAQFGAYFSAKDMKVFSNEETHSWEKLQVAAERCLRVGLYYPTETASGRVTATAVVAGLQAENHDVFLTHVRNLKKILKTKRNLLASKPIAFQNLPPRPQDLENFSQIYPADDQPHSLDETEVDSVLRGAGALRGSHKSVKTARAGLQGMQLALPSSAASSSHFNPALMMQQMNQFSQMMQCFMQGQGGSSGSGDAGVNLQFNLPNPNKRKSGAKAIMDKNPDAEDKPDEEQVTPTKPAAEPAPIMHTPSPKSTQEEKDAARDDASVLSILKISVVEQANWLDAGEKEKSPTPKGKAKAKAKAKTKATPKQKAAAKTKAAQAAPKVSSKTIQKRPASSGWEIEDRFRGSGQRDRYFKSPDGKIFRTRAEAEEAGYRG